MNDFDRRALLISLTALLAGCGGSLPPIGAPAAMTPDGRSHHKTFYYTGERQLFKVPLGVSWIAMIARGAGGGGRHSKRRHRQEEGRGARVHALIPAGAGAGGVSASASGDGGGGASGVRENGDDLRDRVVVAGGGGGGGDIPLKYGAWAAEEAAVHPTWSTMQRTCTCGEDGEKRPTTGS
jgi:hypothetical protein